jgi:hypothetical protein
MTKDEEGSVKLERLRALIETYGGDRDRWPAADRLEMSRLVAIDTDAAAIAEEAKALDRVLDMAPAISADRLSALQARIRDQAMREGRRQGGLDDVVKPAVRRHATQAAEPPHAATAAAASQKRRAPTRPTAIKPAWLSRSAPGPLRSAAMLAASLVVGILAGATVLSGDIIPAGSVAVATAEADDDGMLQHFIADDQPDALEEDFL